MRLYICQPDIPRKLHSRRTDPVRAHLANRLQHSGSEGCIEIPRGTALQIPYRPPVCIGRHGRIATVSIEAIDRLCQSSLSCSHGSYTVEVGFGLLLEQVGALLEGTVALLLLGKLGIDCTVYLTGLLLYCAYLHISGCGQALLGRPGQASKAHHQCRSSAVSAFAGQLEYHQRVR